MQENNFEKQEKDGITFIRVKSADEFGKIGAEYRIYLKSLGLIRNCKHPYVKGSFTQRPYIAGFGCDGCCDLNVHAVVQKMMGILGWNYEEIYKAAYSWRNDKDDHAWLKKDLMMCKDEALKSLKAKDTTLVPENTSIKTMLEELYDVNNRSLVTELEERFEKANIPLETKLKDLRTLKI